MMETTANYNTKQVPDGMKDVVFAKLEDYMHKHDLTKSEIADQAGVSRRSVARLLDGHNRNYQSKVIQNLYELLINDQMQDTEQTLEREPMTEKSPVKEDLVAKNQDLEKKLRRWKNIAHETAEKVNNQLDISKGTKVYIRTYEEDRNYTGAMYQQTGDFIMLEVYDKKSTNPFYYSIRKDDIKFIKTFYE